MPIPAFDSILNALPPHLGDPRLPGDMSPFPCTVTEFCGRFVTTAKRKAILDGFLNLRAELHALGIRGFQWLGGSFVEDIETHESRDPGDLDAITFVGDPLAPADLDARLKGKPLLLSRGHVKSVYLVDHFLMPLGARPDLLVAGARYWYGLFSHRRDGVWKGMLVAPLVDKSDDEDARKALEGKP